MICRYNRAPWVRAGFALVGGLACFFLAYLFFRYLPAFVAWQLGCPWNPVPAWIVTALGLGAVAFSGYRIWRAGGGLQGYHESALYHNLGDTAGAFVVDHYVHRITAPAHVLSQLFLAGPLLLLRVPTLIASLIPDNHDLENRLQSTLVTLREVNKWQAITEHPALHAEILYLAQMGLIDFSSRTEIPRIKARSSHGD